MAEIESKYVSSWYNLHSKVPESYVQPLDRRPCNAVMSTNKSIPVIDLAGNDRDEIIKNIIKSSEEFGFFQVVNHGVAKELVDETVRIFKEFHALPADVKESESSKDPKQSCKLYTSSGRNVADVAKYWKDSLKHPCLPSGEFNEYWPEKPEGYRETVGKYTQELRALGLRILELISEGLGLSPGYFSGDLSANPIILSHHYPPCPEPGLTLGASKHKDPNTLTILFQEPNITALHVMKDGAWIPVEPIPDAFVINMGFMMQILTNGRLIGAEHRVVTNANPSRHTIAYFINPSREAIIGPAKEVTSSTSPPIYPSMPFGELLEKFMNNGPYFEAQFRL